MHHPDDELRQAVALFRYGLIADVLRLPSGSREIRRTLNDKAQRTYTIPGTRRTRVAVETMRDWLSLYRNGGFEALYPKTRTDRGRPRRMPPEVAELLVSLKSEQPALSVKALIEAARERGADHPLAPSTVHRLLSREGLLDKRPGEPVATDRRRFAFRYAGELWMSWERSHDIQYGNLIVMGTRGAGGLDSTRRQTESGSHNIATISCPFIDRTGDWQWTHQGTAGETSQPRKLREPIDSSRSTWTS